MSRKNYTIYIALVGVICCYVIIKSIFFIPVRLVRTDIVQGIFAGFGMAIVASQITAKIKGTKVNGWTTIYGCNEPDNGMLMRAACTLAFPGPINTPEEAMYWTTTVDGENHSLSGKNNYVIRFHADGLPPNNGFWSITMGDDKNSFVPNPINRYSVSDRSGLVPNEDGSVNIYIQNMPPTGHESNWLPAPTGNFILWLRVYIPGETILNKEYTVPPVMEVK
ncbi:MAG: DUF1214 domain-containing protein [Solirubrobacterales bacterium]